MAFFEDVYNKLFPQKKDSQQPSVHKIITRTDKFWQEYSDWKSDGSLNEKLNSIKTSYELKKKGIEQNPSVHVLQSKYANGIAISYTEFFDKQDFDFLLELFAERTKPLDYKIANSDYQLQDKGKYVETTEKKYLKPNISMEAPIDQKFGNILIQNVLIDQKPSFLKLQASIYNDSLYKQALEFDEYLAHILKPIES